MNWLEWKHEFLARHELATGMELASRFFYWHEIRWLYRKGYSLEKAVEKYLNTKVRRAA